MGVTTALRTRSRNEKPPRTGAVLNCQERRALLQANLEKQTRCAQKCKRSGDRAYSQSSNISRETKPCLPPKNCVDASSRPERKGGSCWRQRTQQTMVMRLTPRHLLLKSLWDEGWRPHLRVAVASPRTRCQGAWRSDRTARSIARDGQARRRARTWPGLRGESTGVKRECR